MKRTTLCFLVKEGEVLLAMKKRGFGAGKWNGIGGKVEAGEDIKTAAVREIGEEIGVNVLPDALEYSGNLTFSFNDDARWNQRVSVFLVHRWEGEARETEEMRPSWYRHQELPFEHMWVDDPHWIPLVLAGKKVKGKFAFSGNGESIARVKVREVSRLPFLA